MECKTPALGKVARILRGFSPETELQPETQDPGPPPDSGLTAWTQAVAGHLVAFNTWGFLNTFGVFQDYYVTGLTQSYSPSAISWIGSIQTFLIFFVGTFSGRALDAGLFRPVFYAGVLLSLLGVFMTSLAKEYWQVFLAQGLCFGLGGGLQFTPAIALVSTWFSKRRTLVIAVFLAGSGTGGMVFPAIIRQLLPILGFGWTVRVIGFIMLGTSAVTIALLRTRLPPRSSGPLVEWSAFKELPYTLYITGMFLNFFALYFAFYYIDAFARNIVGLNYLDSINLLIAMNGLGIAGRVVPAYVATTYLGPLNTLIPLTFATSVITYGWSGVHSTGALYTFAVLIGFFANSIQGLWPSPLSTLTEDLSKTGTRMGMGFTVASFALLTGSPVGGALVSRDDGEYLYAQVWAGTSLIVGCMWLVAARLAKTGLQWQSRV